MISKPFTRLVVIGWILLLGVQLTGLSCLDEWRGLAPHASPTLSNRSPAEPVNLGQPNEDGCLCHLAFLSVPQAVPEGGCPICRFIFCSVGNTQPKQVLH